MKQKRYRVHALQESVLFLLLSGLLLWYSLNSHSQSFNKDWSQSPSLFPVVISGLMGVLAVMLLVQGLREEKAESSQAGKPLDTVILIGLNLLYYVALATIKLPYMAVTVFSLTLTLSTFEVVTVAFLVIMMLYLGVRKPVVLIAVPIGTTAFLSIMFRTLLHVLLP